MIEINQIIMLSMFVGISIILILTFSTLGGSSLHIFKRICGIRKQYKIKEQGSFFGNKLEYFNSKQEALDWSKEHLPRGGIFSQAIHHKLFERHGLYWNHVGCYIRDTKYITNKDGEDIAEPLENVVMVCQHVKEHLDKCDKTCNAMLGIRASWLRNFCPKNCKNNAFIIKS